MAWRLVKYKINALKPGMEVGQALLTEERKIALSEGIILDEKLIERLKLWGISEVTVRLPVNRNEKNVFPVNQEQEFRREYKNTLIRLQTAFDTVRYFKEVPITEMQELADDTEKNFINMIGTINFLHKVRSQDDYTFQHSVNVGIISGLLGKWTGYRGAELKKIIMAGLLHDIGKTQIPLEILNKPGKLSVTEMDIMKQHTTYGYQLLENEADIPQTVKLGVLQHHERLDGSGYPRQITEKMIHQAAKIIAIADIYDAMTSDRVYQQKTAPFSVVETIVAEMYHKLDPGVSIAFLNNVRDYFIGNVIQLSDGRFAEVIFLGRTLASRPLIRTDDGEFIDLEERNDLYIVQLVQT